MKKISAFEKEEKEDISNAISAAARTLGVYEDWESMPNQIISSVSLELCTKCYHLRAYQLQFGTEHAFCDKLNAVLNPGDPVINCSEFDDRFQMSLYDMQKIAIILELDDKKIGFQGE